MTDREKALQWALELVRTDNWVAFDTETTDLDGEIVEWAVCNPSGQVLGSGLVKPVARISEEAYRIHHISDAMLKHAPTFDTAWPKIWAHLQGKTVVIYNQWFDVARLATSARAVGMKLLEMSELETRCCMEQYARYHGVRTQHRHGRSGGYQWQSLGNALNQLRIELAGVAHTAAYDAQACAAIVRELARRAEIELVSSINEQRAGVDLERVEP